MTDLLLAILHHLLVFGLVAMMAVQLALVRRGIAGTTPGRVSRIDSGYGIAAGLIVVAGVLRGIFGAKSADDHIADQWFWAKMAAFVVVGLISIGPTMAFIKWRRALKADPAFAAEAAAVARIRRP